MRTASARPGDRAAPGPGRDEPGLLSLSEELQSDLARLARHTGERPSLGLSGEVRLRPERRPAFLADLRAAVQGVLERYGEPEGAAFKIALACYPKED